MKTLRNVAGACVAVFLLLFSWPVFAGEAFDISKTTLTTYTGNEAVVTVPEGVTRIGEKAFYQNLNVTEVILPDTVTHIDASAFEGCTSLRAINFPSGLTDIQNAAFKNCTALSEADLPRALTTLGAQTFYNCTGLSVLTAYEHLTSIGTECFRYCGALTIYCPENSLIATYATLIGATGVPVVYSEQGDFVLDGNVLVSYTGSDAEVTLPEGVTEIGAFAFADNLNLVTLSAASEVTNIQPSAFSGCENLEDFTVPTDLRLLGADAFSGCHRLAAVSLAGSFSAVPEGAFRECTSLSDITLPDSIMVISDQAFSGCTGLAALPSGSGLVGIGMQAFYGCSGLTHVALPEGVAWLGDAAFAECGRMTDFEFSNKMSTTGTKVLKNAAALENVTLKDGLTEIGTGAFDGCTALTGVALPESVTTIGADAFRDTALVSLALPETLVSMGDRAFYGALNNAVVYIPHGVDEMGADAFGECLGLVIQCYYQSKAFEYAVEKGIDYELVGDLDDPFLIDNGVLIRYFGQDAHVIVPIAVTKIGDGAFYNKAAMTTVTLPDTLAEIGAGAFEACRSLTEISIPAGVVSVGDGAFLDCTGLRQVMILGTETGFGENVFQNTSNIVIETYYGSGADERFSAEGLRIQYLPDDLPMDSVVLDALPESALMDDGVVVSGSAAKHGQDAPNADVRIAYQKKGEIWWHYVSSAFMPCDDDGTFAVTLDLPTEGEYRFLAEAKTRSAAVSETACETAYSALYFGSYPVSEITSLALEKNVLKTGENVTMTFETDADLGGRAVETQVEYSRDGLTWINTSSAWSSPVALSGLGGQVIFTLPEKMAEGKYTFRLSLRAEGRETADTRAECTASVYRIVPVKGVVFADLGTVIVSPTGGVWLGAAAEDWPGYNTSRQYCFYYAYNNRTYQKFRDWNSSSTAKFNPKAEGNYTLKVETRSVGRTGVDALYVSQPVMVYLGAVPASDLRVTMEKTDFKYGEAVGLDIRLTEGRPEQITRYQIQYAKAGTTRFTALTGWKEYAPQDGETSVVDEVFIPSNKLNLGYQIRVAVKTEGRKSEDIYQINNISVSVGSPVTQVALTPIETPAVQSSSGIVLEAEALNTDAVLAHAEYRFAYRLSGVKAWTYINKNFSYNRKISAVLKKEGKYDFRVEAKAGGFTATQAVDEIIGVQVYFGAIPALGVNAETLAGETEYLANESVDLTVIGTPCEDERYQSLEYCVLYSTNGRTYKTLPGYGFGEYDGAEPIALPVIKKDAVCYLKVGVRTEDRTGSDAVSEAMLIRRFLVFPADLAELTAEADASGLGAVLSAQGLRRGEAVVCEYRFLYRKAGTTRWLYAGTKFTPQSSITFVPPIKGEYEFSVQVRSLGRTTIDAVSAVSAPIGLYGDAAP